MKIVASLLLFTLPIILSATTEPKTVYTEDRYFVTTGEVNFTIDPWDISTTLLKYNDYSLWAFKGMDGVDEESEGLIASLTDIDYSSRADVFLITFNINLIWPFGRKGSVIKFKPVQEYNGEGRLKSITLLPQLNHKLVEDARMVFYIKETSEGTCITYESRIRLTNFLDFFFTVRSYKRNFEWYVYKMADNFSDYMNSLY